MGGHPFQGCSGWDSNSAHSTALFDFGNADGDTHKDKSTESTRVPSFCVQLHYARSGTIVILEDKGYKNELLQR